MSVTTPPGVARQNGEPFWGVVNGAALKINTMAATGEIGSGKSLLGALIDPMKTLVVDIESSTTTMNLPFLRQRIMFQELSVKPGAIPTAEECFLWWRDCIQEVEKDQYSVVITDPINEIQQGCYDWVSKNPDLFNRSRGAYDKMTALCWGDVKTYMELIVGMLAAKIETFFYTLHMGQRWVNGRPVEGKRGQKAKGSDVFRKMADVLFVLERPVDPATGEVSDKPTGICVPPIGKSRLVHANPVTGEVLPILPPAVAGLDAAKIRHYIAQPPDYKNLKSDERLPVRKISDEEKLEIQRDIAEAQQATEEARNVRIQAAQQVHADDRKIRDDLSAKTAAEMAMAHAQNLPSDEGLPTSSMPTQLPQGEPHVRNLSLSAEDRKVIIIDGAKKLWGESARDNLIASLKKRGAQKFDELSEDQLVDLHQAINKAVTVFGLAKDASSS